jgi:vacuolar-type H+-ATPase subunit I/STV1
MDTLNNLNDKKKTPYSISILILGISSIIFSFFLFGLILGLIGLHFSSKSRKVHENNPELYVDYNYVKAGRILSIIGIIITSLWFLFFVLVIGVGS